MNVTPIANPNEARGFNMATIDIARTMILLLNLRSFVNLMVAANIRNDMQKPYI